MSETIVARTYTENAEGDTVDLDALVVVEASEDEIDLHINPRTEDVVTVSVGIGDAWRLLREMARAIAEAERTDV